VEPVERAFTLAILSRAAAGAEKLDPYQQHWLDAWAVINRRVEAAGKHARALLELARASMLVRDWHHAEKAVRLAATSVSAHDEPAVAAQVEEIAAALRERKDDIRLLVNYFLRKFAQAQKQQPRSISQSALEALERYHWPGNVRELENVMQRAIVVAKGDAILENDLPAEISRGPVALTTGAPVAASAGVAPVAAGELTEIAGIAKSLFRWARQDSKRKIIPTVERELIIAALAETGGNQVQASKLLGITRATLRKRVEKFGIKQELSIS
jgi:hypothetical protein